MSAAGVAAGAVSYAHRTSVWWIGFDRWRADALADRYEQVRVIPAELNGREAYAVVRGSAERVIWDQTRANGMRLVIE